MGITQGKRLILLDIYNLLCKIARKSNARAQRAFSRNIKTLTRHFFQLVPGHPGIIFV